MIKRNIPVNIKTRQIYFFHILNSSPILKDDTKDPILELERDCDQFFKIQIIIVQRGFILHL